MPENTCWPSTNQSEIKGSDSKAPDSSQEISVLARLITWGASPERHELLRISLGVKIMQLFHHRKIIFIDCFSMKSSCIVKKALRIIFISYTIFLYFRICIYLYAQGHLSKRWIFSQGRHRVTDCWPELADRTFYYILGKGL